MPQIDAVSEALEARIAAGDAAGCVALISAPEGVVHESAHGLRAVGGAAMTPDSVFQIASMTKAVGAAAVMRLVEQGRLSLDDDAGAILPDLGRLQVFEGFDGETPRFRPRRRACTVRHLLTHTSGLVYDMWNAEQLRLNRHLGVDRRGAGREGLQAFPFHREPGERWEYGVGLDWVGPLVEAVSGMPIEDFLKREIFDPLAMTSTDVILRPDMSARAAAVHGRGEDGRLEARELSLSAGVFHSMGGCLKSTGPDYERFARMILRGGELDGARVLKAETVRAMGENAIGDLRVTSLPAALPRITAPLEIFPGLEKTHAPGFMRLEADAPGRRRAGTLFWAGLFNTHYWIDPRSGLAAVLMMQQSPFLDPAATRVFEAFERAVYAPGGAAG